MLDEDLEFRGGTLQLSTDTPATENSESNRTNTTDNTARRKPPTSVNPSVLSGANSLTSSTSSFAGMFGKFYDKARTMSDVFLMAQREVKINLVQISLYKNIIHVNNTLFMAPR